MQIQEHAAGKPKQGKRGKKKNCVCWLRQSLETKKEKKKKNGRSCYGERAL